MGLQPRYDKLVDERKSTIVEIRMGLQPPHYMLDNQYTIYNSRNQNGLIAPVVDTERSDNLQQQKLEWAYSHNITYIFTVNIYNSRNQNGLIANFCRSRKTWKSTIVEIRMGLQPHGMLVSQNNIYNSRNQNGLIALSIPSIHKP